MSELTEARLKEIERSLERYPHVITSELIAALRDAWGRHEIAMGWYKEAFERAARAEAERDTLQAMWTMLADAAKDILNADRLHDKVPFEKLVKLEHAVYSEHHDTIAPVLTELQRLRAVREAAEAAYGWCETNIQRDVWRDMVTPLPEEIRDLRRALSAAKDPAR